MPTAVTDPQPPLSLLDPTAHPTKTIDFGAGGVSCSLSTHGRLLTVAGYHPQHGQVIAEPWAQFPADKHHDQPFVRHYRARAMRAHQDPQAGFGLSIAPRGEKLSERSWSFANASWPRATWSAGTIKGEETFCVRDGVVVQHVQIVNRRVEAVELVVGFDGNISVHRAAYTQLTPQGDCTLPAVDLEASEDPSGAWRLVNKTLPAYLDVTLAVNGKPVPISSKQDGCLYAAIGHQTVTIRPQQTMVIELHCSLRSVDRPRQLACSERVRHLPMTLAGMIDQRRLRHLMGGDKRAQSLAFVILRNIDYLVGCCTLSVSPGSVCIITDHQCLPLGWNRDNYWQLRMLHALLPHIDSLVPHPYRQTARQEIMGILRGHLHWAFAVAQRPSGYWARSFFANGVPKDAVFQLDQQCYPLLELAEHAAAFPADLPIVKELAKAVDPVLEVLQQHRWTRPSGTDSTDGEGDRLWLFKTDETPADDEVAFPYHFSSHVLLWRTLLSLGQLREAVGADIICTPVHEWARSVHRDILEHFSTDHPTHGPVYAYLTSTTGEYQFYHDANDLPTALAPAWGFCDRTDPRWKNTLAFAFSPDNEGGWYPGGRFGGLGSVHTRDPWPLGDGQHLTILAQADQIDHEAVSAALSKIASEVQWDGMYSEAVDRHTGQVTSKNWFSWPGSYISDTLLTSSKRLCE